MQPSQQSFSPGAVFLKLRQRYGKGLRVAYYRDIARPRILATKPISDTTDKQCEIHVLTSQQDWLNLIWTLKSFYIASGRRYALCIHDDGSLDATALSTLKAHFPRGRVVGRKDADERAEEALRDFPVCLQFRRTNLLAPKVFDFALYLESDRMAVFDSDLLFFSEPAAFLQRVEEANYKKNTFNKDKSSAYTVTAQDASRYAKVDLKPDINSGFGLVHRPSIRWSWIEEFLALPGIRDGHFWRIEQTLFALCSSRYGFEHLPDEYTIRLQPGLGGRPFRHYVGSIRHLMYGEGMYHLARNRFFEKIDSNGV